MENKDRSDLLAALRDALKRLQEARSLVENYRSEKQRKARRAHQRATERAGWFKRLYDDDEYMRMATRARDRERAEELENRLSNCKYVSAFRRSHSIPEGGFRRHDDIIAWFLDRGLPDALSYEEQVIPWMGRDPRSGEDLHFKPNRFHFLAHCFEEELGEFISRLLLNEYGLRERWYFPLWVYVMTGKLDPPQTKIAPGVYVGFPDLRKRCRKRYGKRYGLEMARHIWNSGLDEADAYKVVDSVPKHSYETKRDWVKRVGGALRREGKRQGCWAKQGLIGKGSVDKSIDREMIRRVRLWMERGIDWTELEAWEKSSDDES